MELVKFMNKYIDWENRLARKPYNLRVKKDDNFVLLEYNIIESDFNLDICKEARGSIFTKDHNEWRCVCRALDKFGNWGESYAATRKIDWSKPLSIQEKIDGSIIKMWNWKNKWYVSTNGTIDAFKAQCGDISYGELFKNMVGAHTTWDFFLSCLDSSYTYWFEMVHPLNQIVVRYSEPTIYYLGRRNMVTMEENGLCGDLACLSWMKYPRHFIYNSLDEVLEACHEMGEDEEGYVVCSYEKENGSFLRIKCKGDEYIRRHHLRGNGPLTSAHILMLWQDNSIDDFIAYFPEHKNFIDEVLKKLKDLIEKTDIAYEEVMESGSSSRKSIATRAQYYVKPIQSYIFARLDNKVDCAHTYFKNMKPRNLAELILIDNIGGK